MTLTIRRARVTDRKYYYWTPYYHGLDGPYKPWVATVNGVVYVVLGKDRTVEYQNGSPVVPSLLRMMVRFIDLQPTLRDDASKRS